jgi:hypothetical protein
MLLPLDPLYRRQFLAVEAMPPLKLEDVVQVPCVFAPSELKTAREHVENRRRQVFTQRKMQRTGGQYTENQRRLREANTPQLFHDAIRRRTREIFSALKPNYLASRVSAIRIWIGMVIEGFGEPGLRTHWPEDRWDDHIMTTFLTMMSMRCVSHAAVEQAFTHVIEGHFMMFAVPPPEFKVARWTLARLKKVMAKERPTGRKIRPGLDVEATDTICRILFDSLGQQLCGHLPRCARPYSIHSLKVDTSIAGTSPRHRFMVTMEPGNKQMKFFDTKLQMFENLNLSKKSLILKSKRHIQFWRL